MDAVNQTMAERLSTKVGQLKNVSFKEANEWLHIYNWFFTMKWILFLSIFLNNNLESSSTFFILN